MLTIVSISIRINTISVKAHWNTTKTCVQHSQKACKAALDCKESIELLNKKYPKYKLGVEIGIAYGKALTGYMGNNFVKKFSLISNINSRSKALQLLNKSLGTSILMTGDCLPMLQKKFVFREVDRIKIQSTSYMDPEDLKPFPVYEIISQKNITADEWMYELKEMEHKTKLDPLKPYRDGYECFLNGEIENCIKFLETYLQTNPKDIPTLRILKFAKSNQKPSCREIIEWKIVE